MSRGVPSPVAQMVTPPKRTPACAPMPSTAQILVRGDTALTIIADCTCADDTCFHSAQFYLDSMTNIWTTHRVTA